MVSVNGQREAQLQLAGMQLEIANFVWPQQVETEVCLSLHHLSFSLSPRPAHTQMRAQHDARYQSRDGGDLMFFPAESSFYGKSDGGPQRLLLVEIADPLLRTLAPGSTDAWSVPPHFDLKDTRLRQTLSRVAQELLNPSFASELLIQGLMTTVLVDLARCLRLGEGERIGGGLAPWQLRRIRERVENMGPDNLSLRELANLCGISVRHLMRGFKQSEGLTLHNYIEDARIQRAKTLLANTDLPLKTIAWQVGFLHASSFSAAFRRSMSVSPSAFRVQSRGHQWP